MVLVHFVAHLIFAIVPVFSRPQEPTSLAQPASTVHSDVPTPIPIVSQTEIINPDGSFNFSYETGNGIRVQEGGYVKQINLQSRNLDTNSDGSSQDENGQVQVIQGTFSYTAPDGQNIVLSYLADENGFQPQGDHLPTSPPIPEEIVKALVQVPQTDQQIGQAHETQPQES